MEVKKDMEVNPNMIGVLLKMGMDPPNNLQASFGT
jgi:hypothetical protein